MNTKYTRAIIIGGPFFGAGVCTGWVVDYLIKGDLLWALVFTVLAAWNLAVAVRGTMSILRMYDSQIASILRQFTQPDFPDTDQDGTDGSR